jgi:glutaredoxin-related protein
MNFQEFLRISQTIAEFQKFKKQQILGISGISRNFHGISGVF